MKRSRKTIQCSTAMLATLVLLATAGCGESGSDLKQGAGQTPAPGVAAPAAPVAAPSGGAGVGETAILNTFSKVWVSGDDKGPAELDRNTGAGTMDAAFAWDQVGYQSDPSRINLLTVFTRSDDEANDNGSYMQGGFALATLTEKGVENGPEIALPRLRGERAFMRPLGAFTKKHVLLIAASEDNGISGNPQPVMFVADKTTGELVKVPNNKRQDDDSKPVNLIWQAFSDGMQKLDIGAQRGPHTIQRVNDNTFIIGMQYNNQRAEALSVTVEDDASVKVNWVHGYPKDDANIARHCRPQVALEPGSNVGYIAAVEANEQPAEIGWRLTSFDVSTGEPIQSEIVVHSDPKNNQYVSEPVLSILGDKLAVTYGLSAKARKRGDATNDVPANAPGHAGGQKVDAAVLVSKTDLKVIGAPTLGVGQYGRHGSSFTTAYGPNAEPALAVISGSSTGTGAGFIQIFPLRADGSLGLKDAAKAYAVAQYSDVANVQARGKRNPNNQARGFIGGQGNVPNPGYSEDAAKAATRFMPDVKSFAVSTVTGYSGPEAMSTGLKNSIYLSLVPVSWKTGLKTIPGKTTDHPGINPDGTGPAARTTATPTNTSGDAVTSGAEPGAVPTGKADTAGGCSVATAPGAVSRGGILGLLLATALLASRRKRGEARHEGV